MWTMDPTLDNTAHCCDASAQIIGVVLVIVLSIFIPDSITLWK